MGLPVFVLLVAAGAALVAQNLLMVHINGMVSTELIPLVMNSAVGLLALLILLVQGSGFSGIGEAIGMFRPWNVLPGLLGSFFVFASILGYQRLGPTVTVSTLVASQLVIGLAIDMMRSPARLRNDLPAVAGAVLLGLGAFLVASRQASGG